MSLSWVLGGRGLLGSALLRGIAARGGRAFEAAAAFDWSSPARLVEQIRDTVEAFADAAVAAGGWEIYWAAGIGSMGSTDAMLAAETLALEALARALADSTSLRRVPGAFALASSAGAIWAGSEEIVISEGVTPTPTTPYAHAKLRQERCLAELAMAIAPARVLIARISTLYGETRPAVAPKGLLAHIARCIVRRQPVRIFVPFDTIRDYMFADDAAAVMMGSLAALPPSDRPLMRIVASEKASTVAEVLSEFRRISRYPPRVVRAATPLSGLYLRCTRFQSLEAPPIARFPITSLPIGLAKLMNSERAVFARQNSGH